MPIELITDQLRIHEASTQEEYTRRLLSMFNQLNDQLTYIDGRIDTDTPDALSALLVLIQALQTNADTLQAQLDARIGSLVILPQHQLVDTTRMVKANGTAVNRADWPKLWAKLDEAGIVVAEASKTEGDWGDGDGALTFTPPDYTTNKRFIRFGNSGGGTLEADQFAEHRHLIGSDRQTNTTNTGSANRLTNLVNTPDGADDTGYTDYQGGSETRPINVRMIPYFWAA